MILSALHKAQRHGFTLIETLLVIGILSILASVVIVAINPVKQLADARDSERTSDVYTIMNAVYQYAADNDGSFPSAATTTAREICGVESESCTGLADLSVLTDDEAYLVSIPTDPLCGVEDGYCVTNGTGYTIQKTTHGRITVSSPNAENIVITVTR